jgi:hypothetical protein
MRRRPSNSQTGHSSLGIWKFRFSQLELATQDWKKVYCVKQNANSNEGLNLDAQDKKLMFANDKRQQQLTDINSGARIGGMS